jgi:RimJ/RimL family protein N-acetyltransferase
MRKIIPINLRGAHVILEPLQEHHRNDLYTGAQREEIWTYQPYQAMGDNFHVWFDKAIQNFKSGDQLPFAVRRKLDNKIVGATRLYELNANHRRLCIGYSWYVPEVWGSFVNSESKFLLLRYAFETLKVNRVEFLVDARNDRSRGALKKFGANEEGILRQHMILDNGFVRDSVVFSIIHSEWPTVKSFLEDRLS